MIRFVHSDFYDDKSFQSTLKRLQAEVDSEFGAILAQREQLETRSHRPRAAIVRKAQAMTDVRHAKANGHEELDILAVKFPWRILQHIASVIRGKQDGARFIDDERGIRCLREGRFQVRGHLHR